MKNRSKKVLFITFLLSAAISSRVSADTKKELNKCLENLEKKRTEREKAAFAYVKATHAHLEELYNILPKVQEATNRRIKATMLEKIKMACQGAHEEKELLCRTAMAAWEASREVRRRRSNNEIPMGPCAKITPELCYESIQSKKTT